MRQLRLIAVLLFCASCSVQPCKRDTILISVTFSDGAETASWIDVTLSDGGSSQTRSVRHIPGQRTGTIEVSFSSGYPSHHALAFTLVARRDDIRLASTTGTETAAGTCATLSLSLSGDGVAPAQNGPDAGGGGDASAPDGGTTPPPSLRLLAGLPGGHGNADGRGAAARFFYPFGVAADGAGHLYVADSDNNIIRKVAIDTGLVATVAGEEAGFNQPLGIASDRAGTLFIADTFNHTIRKLVTATGALSIIAGAPGQMGSADGTGPNARFNQPSGIAVDGAGHLYVCDNGNYTIRRITVATGEVSTLAGSAGHPGNSDGTKATARFNQPNGVAVDGAGSLYVADTYNAKIRKLDAATGAVTTLATPDSLGSPYGITVDSAHNLFISDQYGQTIYERVNATGAVMALAGAPMMAGSVDGTGALARFNEPRGLTVDAGVLYIADTNSHAIRSLVIATGAVTTLAGAAENAGSADGQSTDARLNQPQGVASDGAGNLYIVDTFNSAIRKLVVATGAVSTLAGAAGMTGSTDGKGPSATFNYPVGIAIGHDGTLYVADRENSTIRKITADRQVSTLAGSPAFFGTADGVGGNARFSSPSGLVATDAGTVYVADTDNDTIREIVTATGAVTTLAGQAGQAGSTDGIGTAALFNCPNAIATDNAGTLYIADTCNHTIRKIVIATRQVSTLAGAVGMKGTADGMGTLARFRFPCGLVADGANTLFIADTSNSTIRKLVIDSGAVTTVLGVPGVASVDLAALPARLNQPTAIALASPGVLAVVDTDEDVVLLAPIQR